MTQMRWREMIKQNTHSNTTCSLDEIWLFSQNDNMSNSPYWSLSVQNGREVQNY